MCQFVLDYVLDHIDLSPEFQDPSSLLMASFTLSAPTQPVETKPLPANSRIDVRLPVRVLFQADNIATSFFFAELLKVDPRTNGRKTLGRAKIALKSLPVSSPKRFRFPIMKLENNAIKMADMQLTATLSIVVTYCTDPGPRRQLIDDMERHPHSFSRPQ
jgi:hypothetical protein